MIFKLKSIADADLRTRLFEYGADGEGSNRDEGSFSVDIESFGRLCLLVASSSAAAAMRFFLRRVIFGETSSALEWSVWEESGVLMFSILNDFWRRWFCCSRTSAVERTFLICWCRKKYGGAWQSGEFMSLAKSYGESTGVDGILIFAGFTCKERDR